MVSDKQAMKFRISPYAAILAIFILTEAAIYLSFNIIMATEGRDPIYLKYSGILICLAFSALSCSFFRRDGVVLTAAMVFTAISDFFIFVLNGFYELGVSTFIITQFVYLYRLYADRLSKVYITLAVRVLIAAALMIILNMLGVLDFLTAVVAIYIVMLIFNLAEAAYLSRYGLKNALFAVGLALFLCCDVCVGLNNFGSVLGIALPQGVLTFVSYAMWAFYLPSQVCIVCSAQRGGISLRRNDDAK